MEIREEIKNILSGEKVIISKLSLKYEKEYSNSPLNNAFEIPLKDRPKKVKCYWCNNYNTNWCWNCEKPHCDSHARMIKLLRISIINTLCLECSEEFLKLGKIKKWN